MSTAAHVLAPLGLVIAAFGLWASWHRSRARTESPDVQGKRRVEKALLRGHEVAAGDRSAATTQLTQVLGLTLNVTGMSMTLAFAPLTENGPHSRNAGILLGGTAAILWLGWLVYAARTLSVGRRQGLRPGRLW